MKKIYIEILVIICINNLLSSATSSSGPNQRADLKIRILTITQHMLHLEQDKISIEEFIKKFNRFKTCQECLKNLYPNPNETLELSNIIDRIQDYSNDESKSFELQKSYKVCYTVLMDIINYYKIHAPQFRPTLNNIRNHLYQKVQAYNPNPLQFLKLQTITEKLEKLELQKVTEQAHYYASLINSDLIVANLDEHNNAIPPLTDGLSVVDWLNETELPPHPIW